MLYIPTKTKVLLIILGVGVIIMFFVTLATTRDTGSPEASPLPSSPALTKTGLPIIINEEIPFTEPTFQNYLTTQLDEATEQQVAQLPDQVNKIDLGNGKTKYEFLSTYPGINNIIITADGLAAFKSTVSIGSAGYQTPEIDTYIAQYGQPQVEFTGSARFGRFAKTYIYPELGFAIIFKPATSEVTEVQSFKPTTLDEYIRNWGSDMKDYSSESPMPEI